LAGCEVIDTHTVDIHFSQPQAHPRDWLMISLLPAHTFSSPVIPPTDPVSTRAFGSRGKTAALESERLRISVGETDDHLDVDAIEVRAIHNLDEAIEALQQGQAHGIVNLPRRYWNPLSETDDLYLKAYDLRTWWYVAVNTQEGPLAALQARKAVDFLLDRDALRSTLALPADETHSGNPSTELISGPFLQSSPNYNRGVPIPVADPAAAEASLHSLGWTKVDGRWTDGENPVVLRIGIAETDHAALPRGLAAIQRALTEAGFAVQSEVIDGAWPGSRADLADRFDLFIGQQYERWMMPRIERLYASDGLDNVFGIRDPQVDALLAQAQNAHRDTEQRDAYHALHTHLAANHSTLFLWKRDTKSAWSHSLRNLIIAPGYYYTDYNMARWTK